MSRRRKIAWILRLLGPYKTRLALLIACLLVGTAAALAPPYLAGAAIDQAIIPGDVDRLYLLVGAFIGAVALYALASSAQTYLVGWVGTRLLQDLRESVFRHVQGLSLGFFSRRSTGVIVSRMTNDIEALNQLVSDGLVTLLQSSLTLIGVIVVMLALDVSLALLTFLVFPLLVLASLAFRLASTGAFRATRERIAAINGELQESLSGIRVVRSFAREGHHIAKMSALNEANRAANMRTVYLNAAYYPSIELLSAVGTAVIILYGGYQTLQGDLMIGVVVAFIGYMQTFFDPVQQLSQLYTTYQQGMAAVDKIFELLETDPEVVDRPDAFDPGELSGQISLHGVSFAYEPGAALAVAGVDLDIAAGETIALVGSTGAGKSTLAKLIARFYDPSEGRITVDGHDLRDISQSTLRRQIAIVPQDGFLFSGSLRDNIAFAKPEASDEQIEAAVAAVGAEQLVAELPGGLDGEVGERGGRLSAGQRQLVAFARALLADPRILILDEATANLDVPSERRVERGMERLLAGRTAIIIAHRLSTIQRADRIAVLQAGSVVEIGSHEELREAGGVYASLYASWLR